MKLYDLISQKDLDQAVDEGLVKTRLSDNEEVVWNYTDTATFTKGAFDNPAVRQCRGLVTYGDRVLLRPWEKFFNHNQPEAQPLDLNSPVEVTDKIDGSWGGLYVNAQMLPQIVTRGSFISPQATWATKFFRTKYAGHACGQNAANWTAALKTSFFFEVVAPWNRIVLDYGEMEDLVLLGGADIATGRYIGPEEAQALLMWEGPVTQVFPHTTLGEVLEAPDRPEAEGFCVRFLDESKIVKVKEKRYRELHAVLYGLSRRTVWETVYEGRTLESLLDKLPDEVHDWVRKEWDSLWSQLYSEFRKVLDARDLVVSRLPKGFSQKEFAQKTFELVDGVSPHFVLALHAAKPMNQRILRELKPKGESAYKEFNEDIA